MLRIAVAGSTGRMGKMLIEAVGSATDMTLAGALDIASSAAIGADPVAFLGRASEVRVTSDVEEGLRDPGRTLVSLIDELEQEVLTRRLRATIVFRPGDLQVADVVVERGA